MAKEILENKRRSYKVSNKNISIPKNEKINEKISIKKA
jgi:hypothetical protein